jgi:hypothetical protein
VFETDQRIPTSRKKGNQHHGVHNLLLKDKVAFWEIGGSFPHSLTISYSRAQLTKGYTFVAGIFPSSISKMPKAWTLEGSNDDEVWEKLDDRSEQVEWQFDEARSYELREPAEYKHYRFTIQSGNDPRSLRMHEIRMTNSDEDVEFQVHI